jgi:hypothetical protein
MEKLLPYIILFLIVSVASCGRRALNPLEYVHYVENPKKGLLIKENVNGLQYTLQYEPVEYVTMREMHALNIDPDTFKMQYQRFKGLEHYTLRIGRRGIDSILNRQTDTSKLKGAMDSYFDFGIQKDIHLIEGKDTIPCGVCQYEGDMGGIAPYYSFVLGFTASNYKGDRTVFYKDNLFKSGNVKFNIESSDFNAIPDLKM